MSSSSHLLFVLRHAYAQDRFEFAQNNPDDSKRPLTPKGIKVLKSVLNDNKKLLSSAHLIISSPYERALHTAQISQKKLKIKKLITTDLMTPNKPIKPFLFWYKNQIKLNQIKSDQTVLFVGHEPFLGLLISYLLAKKTDSFIKLKKSALATIEIGYPPSKKNKLIQLINP